MFNDRFPFKRYAEVEDILIKTIQTRTFLPPGYVSHGSLMETVFHFSDVYYRNILFLTNFIKENKITTIYLKKTFGKLGFIIATAARHFNTKIKRLQTL